MPPKTFLGLQASSTLPPISASLAMFGGYFSIGGGDKKRDEITTPFPSVKMFGHSSPPWSWLPYGKTAINEMQQRDDDEVSIASTKKNVQPLELEVQGIPDTIPWEKVAAEENFVLPGIEKKKRKRVRFVHKEQEEEEPSKPKFRKEKKEGPYDAVAEGIGLKHEGGGVFLAKSRGAKNREKLLNIMQGDTLIAAKGRERIPLRITFVTRSKYFAPGRPISSVRIGIHPDDCAILIQNNT